MSVQYFALSPGELGPRGMLRLTRANGGLDLERFDHQKKDWTPSPESLSYLIGDEPDAQEVTAEEANKLIASWK